MGKVSGVEWCGPTWNPWHGCHKISPGCKLCYMYREKRLPEGPNPRGVLNLAKLELLRQSLAQTEQHTKGENAKPDDRRLQFPN